MSTEVAPTIFGHRAFALYWFSRIASILSFHMLVAIGGLGTILVTAIWMFLFPELRRIRSLDEATEAKAVSVAGTETP